MRLVRLAFAFLLLAPVSTFADPAPVISDFATARPVVARHGMVVSQEAAASRAGLDVLKAGGNAVDAAVAVGFALAVTLPRAGNLGGGGFMLIHRADLGKTVAIDYRETAPAATTKDVFLDANGEADPFKSRYSGLAIGVPGTVAGLELAWRKYGSGKFAFAELVAPAIALARQGLTVDDDVADTLPAAAPILAKHPSSARIYLKADGSVPQAGDHIALDDLAATLETIAARAPAGFYAGPVARNRRRRAGGRRADDDGRSRELSGGRARAGQRNLSRPRSSRCRRPRGGAHIIEILNILSGYPLSEQGPTRPPRCTRWRRPRSSPTPIAPRTSAIRISSRSRSWARLEGLRGKACERSSRLTAHAPPQKSAPASRSVTRATRRRISRRRPDGNAVANTYTLNLPYGSGLVADGTGVLLNNEIDDFAAKPGAANAYGLVGGDANAPGPMKRPLSSMSPTLVFKDGKLELATGSPGGSRIITTVLQIIVNVIDHGLNVAEAETRRAPTTSSSPTSSGSSAACRRTRSGFSRRWATRSWCARRWARPTRFSARPTGC